MVVLLAKSILHGLHWFLDMILRYLYHPYVSRQCKETSLMPQWEDLEYPCAFHFFLMPTFFAESVYSDCLVPWGKVSGWRSKKNVSHDSNDSHDSHAYFGPIQQAKKPPADQDGPKESVPLCPQFLRWSRSFNRITCPIFCKASSLKRNKLWNTFWPLTWFPATATLEVWWEVQLHSWLHSSSTWGSATDKLRNALCMADLQKQHPLLFARRQRSVADSIVANRFSQARDSAKPPKNVWEPGRHAGAGSKLLSMHHHGKKLLPTWVGFHV